jgi:hypothetical protein
VNNPITTRPPASNEARYGYLPTNDRHAGRDTIEDLIKDIAVSEPVEAARCSTAQDDEAVDVA